MKIYISLYYKSLMAIMAILLPVIIAFSINFNNNKEQIKTNTVRDLSIIADAYEGLVFQFIQLAKQRAEDFASDGFIRDGLERLRAGDKNGADSLAWHLRNNKKPLDKMLSAIHLISLEGQIIATTDKDSSGLDVSKKDFFIKGMKSTIALEASISAGKAKELFISVPLRGRKDGGVIAVLVNTIPFNKVGEVLSGDYFRKMGALTYGSEGRHTLASYLVNYDGDIIASSKIWAEKNAPVMVSAGPVMACKDAAKESTGFYKNHAGENVAGASMCLVEMKWALLVELDESEIMRPVVDMKKDASIAASIMALLSVILFILFNRAVISPIRNISKAAGDIAEGKYDVPIPAAMTMFGEDEISRLSDSFRFMTGEVRSSSSAVQQSEKRLINAQRIASIGNWSWDIESNELHWYDEVYNIFGLNKEEIQPSYKLFLNAIHSKDRPMVESKVKEAIKERKPYSIDHRILLPDGSQRFVHEEAEIEYDSQGKAIRMVGTIQDISNRKKNEDEIEKSYYIQSVFRTILQNSMGELSLEKQLTLALDLILSSAWFSFGSKATLFLTEGVGTNKSLSLKAHCGFSSDEVLNCKKLPFGTGCCGVAAQTKKIVLTSSTNPCEEISQTVKEPLACYAVPILSKGKVLGVLNVYLDPKNKEDYSERDFLYSISNTLAAIIERKYGEFELKKLSTAIEQSESIIFITNPTGTIEYVNKKFEKTTGYKKEEIIGQDPKILASGDTHDDTYLDLWETVVTGKVWRGIFKNKDKEGNFYWVNTIISPIMDEKGNITNLLTMQEDITEKRQSEERLRYMSEYDGSTGLLNRATFEEKVNTLCGQLAERNASATLILIDIDSLKFINDSFGHETGDSVIKLTADTVKSTIAELDASKSTRQKTLTSRLGVDEFGVFMPYADEDESLEIANIIRGNVEDIHIEGISTKITISVGISKVSKECLNFKDLIARADAAIIMLRTKGRNECAVYRPEDQILEDMHLNLSIKGQIQKTLDEDRFETWFQPILCLKKDTVSHYEVLVRMREEDGNILSPGTFINVAEAFGLIGSIDRIVAEKTMVKQMALGKEGKHITFSINLSGKDLGDEGLLSFLQEKILETGADPHHIVFEITETEAIHDLQQAVKFITELKALGCQFSLDDFGVGFTSFVYLKEMLVDFIKIDGSFIRNLPNSKDDQVVVRSIIDVAKGMGVKTVAEFVETQESLDLLREWGIDYAQGYLIGKPEAEPKF